MRVIHILKYKPSVCQTKIYYKDMNMVLFSKLNENEKEFGSPHTEFKNHLKRTGLIEKVRYVHIGGCVQYGLVRHLGDKV